MPAVGAIGRSIAFTEKGLLEPMDVSPIAPAKHRSGDLAPVQRRGSKRAHQFDLMQSETNCISNVPPIALPRFEANRSPRINKDKGEQ